MSASPLERALVARRAYGPHERDEQRVAVADLGATGIFSNRVIGRIVGLDAESVCEITGKTDKTGGRLNPESLPMLYDAWLLWQRDSVIDIANIRIAFKLGTSWGMIAKLVGLPKSTVWAEAHE